MALIKCNECGKEISDKAKICPHCGFENNLIICPECKKEIKNNVNTCPNCGYEMQKKNKQVKNEFSIGIKIWLILCVVACFGYFSFVNYFLEIISSLSLTSYLVILLGVSYIVLLVNKSKINLYIILGINAVILVYNLFSIGTVVSLLNIICVLINAIITFLVVRKHLNNNKLNLFGIISYSAILFVFIIFPHTYNDNNSNGLTDETQKVIDMINEVDFDVNAPKLNDNDKLYIKSVSKCRNQYHIQFYYYTYDNKLSTQGLITAKDSDKLYNPTVESNKYGLGGWGPQNDIYGYEDCLEDNRDNVEVSLVNFTEEEIDIINENIIPNKRKHSS